MRLFIRPKISYKPVSTIYKCRLEMHSTVDALRNRRKVATKAKY